MNSLWKLKKAFVKDILANWPDQPKPAYNTISTTVRILETKGYISHEAFGRTHQYFAAVSKFTYQKRLMSSVLENAFAGSVTSMVSALLDSEKVSNKELDDLQNLINESDQP